MNIFLPQSIQSVIELEEIADVKRQVINPKSSNTSIGINQDCLLGSYNMTSKDAIIDWKNTMNILSYVDIDLENYKIKKTQTYTGSELFSLIIPDKISIKKGNLEIINGNIISGHLDKSTLGDGKSDAIHQNIWDKYGMDETQKFLDNTQRLVNNYNFYNGFSVGVKDLEYDAKTKEQINNVIMTNDVKSYYKITEIENNPEFMSEKGIEDLLFSWYNVVRDDISQLVANNMGAKNSINIMSSSGSKGEITNTGQMIGCVGQSAFEGGLQPKKINQRTSPFFMQNDDRSDSRGLIKNSLTTGINFTEFVNMMIAGRVGVIDAAVKTAESGYIQRKMIKSLEDVTICYDSTARTANNGIIQFIYGDTCANVTKQYDNTIKLISMNNQEIHDKFTIKKSDLSKFNITEKENDKYYEFILKMRDILRASQVKYSMSSKSINDKFKLPVNLVRIVESIKNNKTEGKKLTDVKYILEQLDLMLTNEKMTLMTFGKNNVIKQNDETVAKTSLKIALHDILAPAKCIYEYNFTKEQFDNAVTEICDNYNKNLVEPGEMVGPISAQSMGEPTTQMTLKSIDYEEKILIMENNKTIVIPIGEYIDELVKDKRTIKIDDSVENEMADTYYLDTNDKNIMIQSVTENGKILWKKVEAVTKHLPFNSDGTKTLLKVITQSGKEVTATKAKSFLARINNKIVPMRGDELVIGTYLPVMNRGEINDNMIPGNVLSSTNESCINKARFIELLNNNPNAIDKQIITDVLNSDVYYDQIVSIQEVNSTHTFVYDFTVQDTKTFCIYNGLCCMDSFHTAGIAGVSTVTQGVPRLKELLSLSKKMKTPQMAVHLTDEFMESKEMAKKIASHIEHNILGQIISNVSCIFDPIFPDIENKLMKQDNVPNKPYHKHNPNKHSCQASIDNLPWVLRIELDKEKMYDNEVTLLDIKSKFCIDWEKRFSDKNIKREVKDIIDKISQIALLSNTNNDKVPILHVRFDMNEYSISIINNFINIIINNIKLKGIPLITEISAGVKEMIKIFNPETGSIDSKTQHVIYTKGVNLFDIRYFNGININKTMCNDIIQIYEVFGIEAARATLVKEFKLAYEISGQYVSYHNLSMIVDYMTKDGHLTSIDRNGVSKTDIHPLARASFEMPIDHLMSAAVFSEVDNMKGVSARVMAGRVIKGGTGVCDIMLDIDMIEKSEFYEPSETQEEKTSGAIAKLDVTSVGTEHEMFIPE